MKLLLTIIIFHITVAISFCCCSAEQYKIYPLGYQNDQLIVAEYTMSRYCENGDGSGENNEFHWHVIINLSYINADTTVLIKNIDSLKLIDCKCDYRKLDTESQITKKLLPSYQKAYLEAAALKGFKKVSPASYTSKTLKDTLSDIVIISTDTSSQLYYQGELKTFSKINWAPCGFLNVVQEIRTYSYEDKNIVIVNLGCSSRRKLPNSKHIFNQENFKFIQTAIIYSPTSWHGLSKDYLMEY